MTVNLLSRRIAFLFRFPAGFCIVFAFLALSLSHGQTTLKEDISIARLIRLLEATAADFRKAFIVSEFDGSEFWRFNSNIEIQQTSHPCTDSSDLPWVSNLNWEAPERKVFQIHIEPRTRVDIGETGIDISRFQKGRLYRKFSSVRFYQSKKLGIAVITQGGLVRDIYFFPTSREIGKICGSSAAKEFSRNDIWRSRYVDDPKRTFGDWNQAAHVLDLIVEPQGPGKYKVFAKAMDPENDALTYNYSVSAGRIIGNGASVVWDLSDAKRGPHKIFAAVDDGIGLKGRYAVKKISIP